MVPTGKPRKPRFAFFPSRLCSSRARRGGITVTTLGPPTGARSRPRQTLRSRASSRRGEGVGRQRRAVGVAVSSSLFVLLEARILRRRLADLLHHAGVDGPRLLAPEPDQLDLEPPLVAIIEQEEHRLAHLGKGGAELGPPDAPHAPVGLAEVGEQLVALLGIVVAVAEAAVEAEGVVEIEAEGADDGRGEVLEGGAARELEVAVEAAAQGGAEDARARIGHARLPAGGDDAPRRASARAGRRRRTEGRIRPPSTPGARGSPTPLTANTPILTDGFAPVISREILRALGLTSM